MSETEQREQELIAGVIAGITQKGPDKWQIGVTPDGSQYAKNLWTKSRETVDALSALIGQHRMFVCNVSHWEQNGEPRRSLWLDSVREGLDEVPVELPGKPSAATRAVAATHSTTEGMSKEEWARKDSAGHKRACIAIAVSALSHTMPADPSLEDLNRFGERVAILSSRWHIAVIAERDDPTGEGIPF